MNLGHLNTLAASDIQSLLWLGCAAVLLVLALVQWRQRIHDTLEIDRLRDQHARQLEQLKAAEGLAAGYTQELAALRSQCDELRATNIRGEERLQYELKAAEEKIALLTAARKQLSDEFQSLAGKIFEEKRQHFTRDSKQVLDGALSPLREQLKDFKRKVEDVYDKESKERLSLLHEVGQLKSLNQQMSQDAVNLTRALKGDKKTQGNWGEVVQIGRAHV